MRRSRTSGLPWSRPSSAKPSAAPASPSALSPEGYWPLVREICDRHQVILILDEVMCGMGRTGKWFAAGHYHVVPDIMVLGKGLSGGTLALSAVATSTDHMETVRRNSGNFVHGGTFSHNGIACAAGLAAVRILEREQLVERAAQVGRRIGQRLHEALAASPHVGDIRGIGMMWGSRVRPGQAAPDALPPLRESH